MAVDKTFAVEAEDCGGKSLAKTYQKYYKCPQYINAATQCSYKKREHSDIQSSSHHLSQDTARLEVQVKMSSYSSITKIRLFKYVENFTTKN